MQNLSEVYKDGILSKVAKVGYIKVTEDDINKINELTLEKVEESDVFIFKATMADNMQDDRNNYPFTFKALQDLKKLYKGKTVLFDHERKSTNQIARIYDTEIIINNSAKNEIGEPRTELIAKIYMIKTSTNADLIAEIKGGIKKEVSTSCTVNSLVCNICNVDNLVKPCTHYPGRQYTLKDGKSKMCNFQICGCSEAYELSFVAVPAQPRAGVHKNFNEKKELEIKSRLNLAFVFLEKNQEELNNE